MLVQDPELHEKQIAKVGMQTVHPDDGRHAEGDCAGLDEEADCVPRILGRVEGIQCPDRKFAVLHGHEEEQGDHEENGQRAEPVEGYAGEQQVLAQNLALAANLSNGIK